MEDQWRRENRNECFIQRLALKSWVFSKVFPSSQIRVGSRDISAYHTFRILLDKFPTIAIKIRMLRQSNKSLDKDMLEEKLETLMDEIDTFASPLPISG